MTKVTFRLKFRQVVTQEKVVEPLLIVKYINTFNTHIDIFVAKLLAVHGELRQWLYINLYLYRECKKSKKLLSAFRIIFEILIGYSYGFNNIGWRSADWLKVGQWFRTFIYNQPNFRQQAFNCGWIKSSLQCILDTCIHIHTHVLAPYYISNDSMCIKYIHTIKSSINILVYM